MGDAGEHVLSKALFTAREPGITPAVSLVGTSCRPDQANVVATMMPNTTPIAIPQSRP